jgi:hypothetical protein
MTSPPKELVVLAADSHIEQTLLGLLPRYQAFGIRRFPFSSSDILVHPEKDGGCRTTGAELLRNFCRQYRHALLMFDHTGCGREAVAPDELERLLDDELGRTGWADRARTIVLHPELEVWVWSPSPAVDRVVGWSGRLPGLRDWLVHNEWAASPSQKPQQAKEALQAALREVNKAPSAQLFRKLAAEVSFQACQDRAFVRLWKTLKDWFPPLESQESPP